MASPKIKSTKNFILKDYRSGNIIIILYLYYINFIFFKNIYLFLLNINE